MKNLLVAAIVLPLSAGAEAFVEAVRTVQVTGLENTYPAWSPDGRQIAFASNRANSEFEAFNSQVAAADGSNPARVSFGNGIEGAGS